MSFATDTLTGQQRAVAVLAAILATPGLAAATWTIQPDLACAGIPELNGQLDGRQPIADLRAAVDAYFLAFNLRLDEDQRLSGTDRCEAFTEIGTSGVVDGVHVKVWGAGR